MVRQEEGKGKEEQIDYKENYQLAEIKEREERKTPEIVCYPIIPTNIIPALKGSLQEAAFHVLKSQVSSAGATAGVYLLAVRRQILFL